MDKSRQYIQMCKTSKEIQSLWQAKTGDFYADMKNLIHCWIPSATPSYTIKKGFGIKSTAKVIQINRYTWLPRLDQLIEAAQTSNSEFRNISFMFYEWVKKPYSHQTRPATDFFSSQEQMWLAFIMDTKFNKTWWSEKWVD